MNKRVFSIALALILALASMACAFAAPDSPDSTSVGEVKVTGVASSTGAVLPATFAVAPVEVPTATEKVVLDAITAAATSADSLADFFGTQTMMAVTATVTGVDVSKLTLDEAFPISVASYDVTFGDITVTMSLAKEYADGDVVVALVGIVNADGTITWTPVQATVVEGELAITFTQDLLSAAGTNELVFAVLSEGVA